MSLSKIIEKKKKEKELQQKKKNAKNLAMGATLGVAIGAISGVLFAPKSGKETRENIKKTSSDINDTVKEKVSTAKDTLKEKATEAHSKIKEYISSKEKFTTSNDDIVEDTSSEIIEPISLEEEVNEETAQEVKE